MDTLIFFFAAFVALSGILASIGVWAPRRLWIRSAAVAAAGLLAVVAYASLADLLGKPKPIGLEWAQRNLPEARVIGAAFREGDGIYLWLELAGVPSPRSYVMPWDRDMAQQLQEALEQAQHEGGGVRMTSPFEPSLDDRTPKFYADPRPAPPRKDAPPGPQLYDHPDTEADGDGTFPPGRRLPMPAGGKDA